MNDLDPEIMEIKNLIEKTIETYRGKSRQQGLQKAYDKLFGISAEYKSALEEYSFLHLHCLETIGKLRSQIVNLNEKLRVMQGLLELPAQNDRPVVKSDQNLTLDQQLAAKCWKKCQISVKIE